MPSLAAPRSRRVGDVSSLNKDALPLATPPRRGVGGAGGALATPLKRSWRPSHGVATMYDSLAMLWPLPLLVGEVHSFKSSLTAALARTRTEKSKGLIYHICYYVSEGNSSRLVPRV